MANLGRVNVRKDLDTVIWTAIGFTAALVVIGVAALALVPATSTAPAPVTTTTTTPGSGSSTAPPYYYPAQNSSNTGYVPYAPYVAHPHARTVYRMGRHLW